MKHNHLRQALKVVFAMVMTICLSMVMAVVDAEALTVQEGRILTTLKEYSVAPGISEQHITTVDSNGNNQVKAYAATVDMSDSNVGFLASYKDYNSDGKWGFQTVRDQAKAAERKTGKKVVAAINGDYFDMGTGQPLGALVMNGKIVQQPQSECYFAVLKNGQAVIRNRDVSLDDVQEAIGAPFLLLKDGKVVAPGDPTQSSRCAVGIKADGDVVIYTADGRQAPMSVGECYRDTANMLKSLGCVDAAYLDGGGSATFATRSEGTDTLTVKNSPSDGIERSVSSALLIYSDAKPSGVFNHAVLTPQEEVYTPESEVQFEAKGVDSAGGKAEIPADAKYTLTDDSMGTIDAMTGLFKSNGKTGTVEVNLSTAEGVKGKTEIEIQKPDKISFLNEDISLGWEMETDLELMVSYQNREINYKDGDFEWSYSNVTDLSGNPFDTEVVPGTFNGNIFTTAAEGSMQCDITCKYKDSDVSGSIKAIIGQKPTVAMDFEDYTWDDGTIVPAKDYWSELKGVTFPTDPEEIRKFLYEHKNAGLVSFNYGRGGRNSFEIVDTIVRNGKYAMKLNYDFSQCGEVTEGANVGLKLSGEEIPGTPTAIGAYVYVPEGTPNLWLRMQILDGDGNVVNLSFTEESKAAENGIGGFTHSGGWKYLELDLTPYKAPFKVLANNTFRLMFVAGTGMGKFDKDGNPIARSDCKGSIYIDDLQFVYGANPTDTDNPQIDIVNANNVALKDGDTINTNKVTFQAIATDVQNKNTSGVDFSLTKVYIDGKKLIDDSNWEDYCDPSKDSIFLYNKYLTNGTHKIKYVVGDKERNIATKTITFKVDGSEQDTPDIYVKGDKDSAYLGESAVVHIETDKIQSVGDVSATFKISKGFTDYKVEYGDGYEEGAAPVIDEEENRVTITAKKTGAAEAEGKAVVAALKLNIPDTTAKGTALAFSVEDGCASVVNSAGEAMETTFMSSTPIRVEIKSKYNVKADNIIAGYDAVFYVTTEDGEPVKNIEVYNSADNSLVGTTDNSGILHTSLFRDPQEITVYAKDANGIKSFVYKTQCNMTAGNAEGKPEFVKLNASKNPDTAKNITWISNPAAARKAAIAQVAAKEEYQAGGEQALTEYKGTVKLVEFNGATGTSDDRTAYANIVEVTGLNPDTEYVYRVGDGEKWSEMKNFSTSYSGKETKFFIIGDTQAEDTTAIDAIVDTISQGGYNFGIQTGDFVDEPTRYPDWDNILGAFDKEAMSAVDMIHVTGNHELSGNPDGSIVNGIFNVNSTRHYSVTYGNVYVAVIGYANDDAISKADAEWLVKDAKKSKAKWKIVTMHQPPYGTNETTKDCEKVNKYIAPACDAAGIDFVFSGHDHSYARTNPLTAGKRDEANGVVYFVCGSTGEKSYPATNERGYDFAKWGTDFSAIYLTVSTTDKEFKITVNDVNGGIIDEYTKVKVTEACKGDVHQYIVKEDGKHLVCSNCGNAILVNDYTGLVSDEKTGELRYLTAGAYAKERWIQNDVEYYYMNEEGYAATGTVKIKDSAHPNGIEYTFDDDGKFVKGSFVKEDVTNPADGKTKTITRYYTGGGVIAVHWMKIDGNMYYFKKTSNNDKIYDLGMMYTGNGVRPIKVNAQGIASDRYFTFAEDGKLVVGAFETTSSGTRYFWGDDYVTGVKKAAGVTYTFDDDGYMLTQDINDCSFEVPASVVYKGKAVQPAVVVKDGKEVLSNDRYNPNYTLTYANNNAIGTGTVTIKGNPERGYTGTKKISFKITDRYSISRATVKAISNQPYTGGYIKPELNITYNGKELIAGTDYTVAYSNNKYVGTATAKITGKGDYKNTITKTFNIVPKATTVRLSLCGYDDVKVAWNKVSQASGYRVYYRRAGTTSWTTKGFYTGTSVSISNLADGVKYEVAVRPYKTINGARYYAPYKAVTIYTLKSTNTTLSLYGYDDVKVTWDKVTYASGYKVYYRKAGTSGWTTKGYYTGTSVDLPNLADGTKYEVAVRPYKVVGKTRYYAPYKTKSIYTLKAVKTKLSLYGQNGVKVTWDKVTYASGYRVYYRKAGTSAWTTKGYYTGTSVILPNLADRTKYEVAVRPYKVVGKTRYYAPYKTASIYT